METSENTSNNGWMVLDELGGKMEEEESQAEQERMTLSQISVIQCHLTSCGHAVHCLLPLAPGRGRSPDFLFRFSVSLPFLACLANQRHIRNL